MSQLRLGCDLLIGLLLAASSLVDVDALTFQDSDGPLGFVTIE